MAGSFAPRAATERPAQIPVGSPGHPPLLPRWVRVALFEGAAVIVLTLLFFAGFLAVLSLVFPTGQDLRVLLQADRNRSEAARSLDHGAAGSPGGPFGGILASLQVIRPVVRMRPAGAIVWGHVGTGTEFRAGDGIQTGAKGSALVEFASAQIRLESNSMVILGAEPQQDQEGFSAGAPTQGFMVLQGEVAARVDRGADAALRIRLPNGVAALRGRAESPADVVVAVDRDQSARVTTMGGSVALESKGHRVVLGPHQFSRVSVDGDFTRPLAVPEVPTVESPEDRAQFEFLDLPPKVRFRWSPVEGPGEWRVVVARDPAMTDVVVDERVTSDHLDWGRFEPGRYYWQVTRLVEGVPSAPSRARSLSVTRELLPLRLEVDPLPSRVDGLRFTVHGRTLPGANVFVKGQPATVQPDGTFSADVPLEPGANIILVEAVAKGGRSVYSSHVVHAKPQ